MTDKPKSVYLEQSALSRAAFDLASGSGTPLYDCLFALQEEGKIQVWGSAHNAIELCLCTDLQLRQKLSQALENLTRGRRILPSFEFVILQEFLHLIDTHWPGCVQYDIRERLQGDNQRIYSGVIAHMAALVDYDASGANEELLRSKKLSRLKHTQILLDPNLVLSSLKMTQEEYLKFHMESDKGYATLSVEEMEAKIQELLSEFTPGKDARRSVSKFQKNREDLIAQRIVSLALPALVAAVPSPWDSYRLMNYQQVIADWDQPFPHPDLSIKQDDVTPLPPDFGSRTNGILTSKQTAQLWELLLERYHRLGLLIQPAMMLDLVFRELEKMFATGEPPTEGLTFDVDHASALHKCDIFLCYDNKLSAGMKIWADKMVISDGSRKQVATSIAELKRAVE
ncbi:hypothetical protein KQI84_16865 [bacterium]|nr:hypothetical protein [bacterium]